MVPVNPNKPVKYEDKKTGIVYSFRVLTDEMSEEFDEINRIYEEAQELSKAEKTKEAGVLFKKHMRAMIDFFLVGWEGCAEQFPTDCKPSDFFIGQSLYEMVNVINGLSGQLFGMELEEAKN